MPSLLRVLSVTCVLALLAFAYAACKQGENQRCQIQSDCQEGLVCSADGVCRQPTQIIITIDASPPLDVAYDAVPPDSAPVDAPPVDAGFDI